MRPYTERSTMGGIAPVGRGRRRAGSLPRTRVGLLMAAIVLASVATAGAQAVNSMPASCRRHDALDAAEYQRMWRFLTLGGGYRMWAEKDCYPYRLDEA